MRVLFTTWNMNGHLNPMVPLGWALRAAGHEVVVASNPDLVPAITRSGLPALGVGPQFDSFGVLVEQVKARGWRPTPPVDPEAEPDGAVARIRRRSLLGLRVAVQAADAQADELVAFCRDWRPDLVVFEPTGYAGLLVARLHGIPAVRHLWSVDLSAPVAEFETDLVGELAARFGLDRLGINGDVTLDPCPAPIQVHDGLPRRPIRFVPYNGPSVVPDWLREPPSAPRICITWGTSLDRFGFDDLIIAPAVAEALTDCDVEVVIAVADSQRDLFGPLPGNVRFLGPVPLHLVLPSCAGVVHQGGAGGTMTSLLFGVPQVVLAAMPDGVFHARQVERAGAGRYLPAQQATTQSIRDAVLSILDGDYPGTARALRDRMLAMPAPVRVAADLAELAGLAQPAGVPVP
ncbi:MAG: DUF1205 domain-containing protein [Micromonosporaceae bacterium]|nr:DUF1205 domain-containing protein [Micromonosporaceae bacterium]